ncbi:hypothetical protein ASPZODRAFT_136870 [Penicilliopsis zonata CBS 506.65]|uniref:DNA repair protein RAD16 n=1 Tax=Penicilliopsis zonata CBS 506.65 TaxID=1073090 RepID=A0A1L9S759_9EURO|nr:hypothetical protein ASPZODRAFT_136870 [Penicilliopsis zonata CBS 506.65]OJJ42996.1 hypothetical protein ASPZODRAFT_136870 [Penicilliopsis zonata CBS 506.65]
MGRRSSTAKAKGLSNEVAIGPNVSTISSSFPRRSSRVTRNSLARSNEQPELVVPDTEDDEETDGMAIDIPRRNRIEVAIPVRKINTPSTASSTIATEDISADGTTEYNTPATSVAETPAAPDTSEKRKRVSASARASELRSSALALKTRSTAKRSHSLVATEESEPETADAVLARDLQLQEYDRPLRKRQKTSRAKNSVEIRDSFDTESFLSELSDGDGEFDGSESSDGQTGPATRRSLRSKKVTKMPIIDTNAVDDEKDESYVEDFESSDSEVEEEPVLENSPRPEATNRTPTPPPQPWPQRPLSPADMPDGWTKRAWRERKKLEKQHPCITTMWGDLENTLIITPVPAQQPARISRQLKSFQLEGLNWMVQQEKTAYRGGLLGDEMGMGKTIQAVSLVMSDYPAGKPSLVLVPPVALMQWQSEIKEYTNGQLKVLVYHNTNPKVKNLRKEDLETYDVIMISYSGLESIYRKELKGWNRNDGIVKEDSVIHSIHYHRLILDEAHSIKQRTTSVARACFALKADYRWCLSGTPVQNRIGEFFSLLRFLEVRPFACYFCKQCPCQQLHWSQDAEKKCTFCQHSGFSHVSIFNQEILNPITEHDSPEKRADALKKLRLITDRIMLRRMKKDHTSSMELPPKRVVLHSEFFGEIERDFSQSIMTNSSRQFDTYVSRGVMLNNYANIFGLIMQMRQVSNHPDLILKKHAEIGQNVLVCSICDEPAEEAIRSRCRHEFCRQCAKDYIRSFDSDSTIDCPRCHIPLSIDFEQPDIDQEEDNIKKNSIINRIKMEDWTSSTKIEMLIYDLYQLRGKKQTHKSIVFSQFTSMLQLVEWRLRRAGFNTVMLDGTMTPAQRQKSIDYFMKNVDVEVFLVSLKAGGVALNLTEASRVFIIDPWWNPAAEWQSADRCHRIGQRRPCVITRLCIEDSVESRIVLLQEKKANMIKGTINKDQGAALEKLTPEDMQFLFRGS